MNCIKIQHNEEIRRLPFQNGTSFQELTELVYEKFHIPLDSELCIKFFDGEDNCIVSNDAELEDALAVMLAQETILKLVVSAKAKPVPQLQPQPQQAYPHSPCPNPAVVLPNNICWKQGRRNWGVLIGAASFFLTLAMFHPVLRTAFFICLLLPVLLVVLGCLLIPLILLFEFLARKSFRFLRHSAQKFEEYRQQKNKERCEHRCNRNPANPSQPSATKKETPLSNTELQQLFSYELKLLSDMGFLPRLKVIEILKKNNGDIDGTVSELLGAQ